MNRILDDLAKVANGAATTLVGIKDEVEALVRQRLERLIVDMELVTRDEFEAVKAMAAKARLEQERLEARLREFEPSAEGKGGTRLLPRRRRLRRRRWRSRHAAKPVVARKEGG